MLNLGRSGFLPGVLPLTPSSFNALHTVHSLTHISPRSDDAFKSLTVVRSFFFPQYQTIFSRISFVWMLMDLYFSKLLCSSSALHKFPFFVWKNQIAGGFYSFFFFLLYQSISSLHLQTHILYNPTYAKTDSTWLSLRSVTQRLILFSTILTGFFLWLFSLKITFLCVIISGTLYFSISLIK